MKHQASPQPDKVDSMLDAFYWLLAVCLFLLLSLFPEQIVDFWAWLIGNLVRIWFSQT